MASISGRIISGTGSATKNLQVQLPMIASQVPDIAACYRGTINVKLDSALLVLSPDFRTEKINWHPEHAPGEIFDLLRIQFSAESFPAPIHAWLYIAHNSPHRKDLRVHEVLAPRIQIKMDEHCRICIDRPTLELPYRARRVIVVTQQAT